MFNHGLFMNPAVNGAFESGCALATMMGVGLAVEVRRVTEWHRRDGRFQATWESVEGEAMLLIGSLTRARHIFEITSAGVVIAHFPRRYEADAFVEGFTRKTIRSVTLSIARLRAMRFQARGGRFVEAA